MQKRLELIIFGKVHGIFFRKFIKEKADLLNLKGFVQNESNNTVKVVAEGQDNKLQELIIHAKSGPKLAQVVNVEVNWLNPTNKFKKFDINY